MVDVLHASLVQNRRPEELESVWEAACKLGLFLIIFLIYALVMNGYFIACVAESADDLCIHCICLMMLKNVL